VPLKTLIDRSPFTLPSIKDYIYVGNKISNIYCIDILKGLILNQNEGDDLGSMNNSNSKRFLMYY